MLLISSAAITCFDCFLIGLILGINKTTFSLKNKLTVFLTSFLILLITYNLYKIFNNSFLNYKTGSILFLLLGIKSFFENSKKNFDKNNDHKISFKEAIILSLSISLDSVISSFTLASKYNYYLSIITYSSFSILFISLGISFSKIKLFKNIKKSNYISATLYFILSIIFYFEIL